MLPLTACGPAMQVAKRPGLLTDQFTKESLARHAPFGSRQPLRAFHSRANICSVHNIHSPTLTEIAKESVKRCSSLLAACLLTGLLSVCPVQAVVTITDTIQSSNLVLDTAKILPDEEERQLEQTLKELEQRTDWRLRVLTRFGPKAGPTENEVKAAWAPNDRTVIVIVDPSSPNILDFSTGQAVEQLLRRTFFVELQSRYGNKFFVRDEGEDAAILGTVGALSECLQRPGGCAVVPGIPSDQYTLTLITSLVGGVVFGYSLRLEPSGPVRRQWVWSLLFAPLWGSLFINFGIGPIVSRTSDPWPIVGNAAGFAAAAALVQLSPLFAKSAVEGPLWKKKDP